MSKYTNELKLEIVKYVVESKHTFNEASKKFGVFPTVYMPVRYSLLS